jgi:hypothetical protein
MKNVVEVLRAKEQELYRVRLEIAALKLVGPMLTDGEDEGPKKLPRLGRLLLVGRRQTRRTR